MNIASARSAIGGIYGCLRSPLAPRRCAAAMVGGFAVLDFSPGDVEVTIERPPGLVTHDLAAIKGHGRYPFLRDMPPCPPPLAA